MELFFLLFLFLISVALGAIGLWRGNSWLASISAVLFVGLGGLVLSTPLRVPLVESITVSDVNSAVTVITPSYLTIVPGTDVIVSAFGLLLFFTGIVFFLATLYYAGRDNTEVF